MALITLGGKTPVIKLNTNNVNNINTNKKDLSPEEIKEAVKNMNPKERAVFLEFLITKVEEEKVEILKAFSSFDESLRKSVICRQAKIATAENIEETYDTIVKILQSDFTGMTEYQINILKDERKTLIKDLSLAYYSQFK